MTQPGTAEHSGAPGNALNARQLARGVRVVRCVPHGSRCTTGQGRDVRRVSAKKARPDHIPAVGAVRFIYHEMYLMYYENETGDRVYTLEKVRPHAAPPSCLQGGDVCHLSPLLHACGYRSLLTASRPNLHIPRASPRTTSTFAHSPPATLRFYLHIFLPQVLASSRYTQEALRLALDTAADP